jgi:hypothetical protein
MTRMHRTRHRSTTVGGKSGKGKYLKQTLVHTEDADYIPLPKSDRGHGAVGHYVKRITDNRETQYAWFLVFGPNKPNSWQSSPPPIPYASRSQADAVASQYNGYTEIAY